MTGGCVCFRLSRRAVAAVTIEEDRLGFYDGRHLSSNQARGLTSAERYFHRILDLTTPTTVVIDAPLKDGSQTARLLQRLQDLLAERKVVARVVATTDVLSAFGVPGVRSRTELVRVVEPYWAELATMRAKVKRFVVEAAACALYVDVEQAFGPAPT